MRQPAFGHVAAVSLEVAAVNFVPAAVSHVSSSCGELNLNDVSACLAWHLAIAAVSFETAFTAVSSHFAVVWSGGMLPMSSPPKGVDPAQ